MGLLNFSHLQTPARPPLWRLSVLQCVFWLVAMLLCKFWWPSALTSVGSAGLIAIVAQAYWIWRSLRGYGDPQSNRYLAGTTAGLIGKWAIIGLGLVGLWYSHLDISVAITVVTVFALNTLAAILAPVLIS